jgi:hypothetical protein
VLKERRVIGTGVGPLGEQRIRRVGVTGLNQPAVISESSAITILSKLVDEWMDGGGLEGLGFEAAIEPRLQLVVKIGRVIHGRHGCERFIEGSRDEHSPELSMQALKVLAVAPFGRNLPDDRKPGKRILS